jgi:hypothetical protein
MMTDPASEQPTPSDAAAIVLAVFGEPPAELCRFPTGLCHFVFDVVTRSGRRVVVRIGERRNLCYLQGAVYWSTMLRPLGVPLPALLDTDLDARHSPFPSIILERLPGTDLGGAYPHMSAPQKRSIATRVVETQRFVATLPEGTGFGFASTYDTIPFKTWSQVVAASLDRSARWIADAGVVSATIIDRVRAAGREFESYFAAVRPTPFLDDTTTKNVIIDDGRLSGIVDVDHVCFGDPLFTPALTQMSLLASAYATDYIDYWCDALAMTPEQRLVMTFYTAVFCVNFLAEFGQAFNSERPMPVDPNEVTKLLGILDRLLASLAAG